MIDKTSITEAEIEETLSTMTEHMKEHLKLVTSLTLRCFRESDKYSGLLLIKTPGPKGKVALIALNADEEDAVTMMTHAMHSIVQAYEEVPPKDQLN